MSPPKKSSAVSSSRLGLLAALLALPLAPLRAAYDLPALEQVEKQISAVAGKTIPCVVGLSHGSAQGSGCVITPDGVILTAGHVVGDAKVLTVTFPDQKQFQAKVLGINRTRDIALALIDGGGKFPYAELGDTRTLVPGAIVVALGHPAGFDPRRTPPVRFGRVLEFSHDAFIRTDCTVVVGDSGGPLFDLSGRLIGVHAFVGTDLTRNNHAPAEAVRQDWDRLVKGEQWGRLQTSTAPKKAAARSLPSADEAFPGLNPGKLHALIMADARKRNGVIRIEPDNMKIMLRESGVTEEAIGKYTPADLQRLLRNVLGMAEPEKPNEIVTRQDQEILAALKPRLDAVAASIVKLNEGNTTLALGTVVRDDGFILTKHSDLTKARELKVQLADGRSFPSAIVQAYPEHDLALVKIQASQLRAVSIPGNEGGVLRLGSFLFSPGIAPGKPLVGQGVVSVLERSPRESGGNSLTGMGTEVSGRSGNFALVFQHDQTLRPQECGSIVLDLRGNIVGVNVARVGRAVSYAVPARLVSELLKKADFRQLTEKAAKTLLTPPGS